MMPNIVDLIKTSLERYYDPHTTSIIMGMTYGIKSNIDPTLYRDIRSSGLSHLIVFSGSNIVILYSIFKGALRFLDSKPRILLSSGILLAFLSILPLEPSTIRATIMWGLVTLGELLYRKTNAIYIITITAITMLVFEPQYMTNISFQLSFAALLGIITFNKNDQQKSKSILTDMLNDIKTTVSAQAFTLPLILYYFNNMNLASILPNIIISPLIRPILYLGLLTPAVSIVLKNKLHVISYVGNTISYLFISVVNIFKQFEI